MDNKDSGRPDLAIFAGAAVGIGSIVYLIGSSFARPHGASPFIDVIVLLAAIAVGLAVMIFTAQLLFPNGERDIDESKIVSARLKMGAAIFMSMLASSAVGFVYFFLL